MKSIPNFEMPDVPTFNPDDYSTPFKDPIGVASFSLAAGATSAVSRFLDDAIEISAAAGNVLPG